MTAETETITNGELNRAVKLIRDDIKEMKNDVDKKPSQRDLDYLATRLKDLEDWQKWAMRIGIPAIIGIVVNMANTIDGKIPG